LNEILKYSLGNLDMLSDTNQCSGLVPVQYPFRPVEIDPEEFIAVENAIRYKADYVYFRRFETRQSIPQVYLYDFTNKTVSKEELIDLHKQLYSSGLVPMFFVFTKEDIRIFNCFERPAIGNQLKYKPLTVIKLAATLSESLDNVNLEKFRAFSGRSFDNGTFWENSKFRNKFNFSNSAYEKLLSELKQALKDIISKDILPANIARKIMVISILIKYLEEREDENGNKVFPEHFFNRFVKGATRFTDVLNKTGAYLELLDYLAKHFSGGVFQLESYERDFLKEKNLSRFGQFLSGEVDGVQMVLWRLYSFNDLPVELISNIYEEFLEKQPGVVYTPSFLVNFLLDEAMPFTDNTINFKILDPACGSGVFLVGAYRRLVYRWRKNNNWENPSLKILKKLLKENIYGVDKDRDATNLTVFSLSLALCDELEPLQIWEELKFDNLHGSNIIHRDFFNAVSDSGFLGKFDLVIGNPPFEAKLTPAAKNIEAIKSKKRKFSIILKNGKTKILPIKLPDNQIALLFLEQSLDLCKDKGLVCLIQPSGPFLYNNSSFRFRQFLVKNYHIPQIIDFTHISRVLFGENGDVATAAVFIKNEKAIDAGLLHITVRRTKPHKEKLYFELDTYDFHYIPRKVVLEDPLIWKSNFIGGGRYHQLILRLSEFPTFKEYLEEKKLKGWAISEGFTSATENDLKRLQKLEKDQDLQELLKLKRKLLAPHISEKCFLPTAALKVAGIDQDQIMPNTPFKYFHSKGDQLIYEAPHLLIKELIVGNKIPLDLSFEYLTFQRRIIGIHAPKEEVDRLKGIANRISFSKIYPFYIAATSGQYLVNKSSAIYKQDIENLPFPNHVKDLETTSVENILIDDFYNFLLEYRRNGEKSKIAIQNSSEKELLEFGKVFCDVLNTVFKSTKSYTYFETDSFICYPFYFGDKPNIDFTNYEQAEINIEKLVRKNLGVSLRLTRIIRMYEGNVIYLIKPKKLRYWLRSIALLDADETFSDLIKQGY
jgi:type I restriction-modification system DNA methylase subunit